MAKAKNTNKTQKEKSVSKKTKARPQKAPQKDIMDLQQLDGKLYNKKGVRSIDELLGLHTTPYNTHDVKEYELQLDHMNTSDLQTHAVKVGVLPKEDRRILIKTLIRQFQLANSSQLNTAQPINLTNKKLTQETIDILAEGR